MSLCHKSVYGLRGVVASLFIVLVLACMAGGQDKGKALTGRFEGTAKDKAANVIDVAFELTEKDGAMSGMIRSSHGDFTITGGSHKGDAVTLEFDTGGGTGTISLSLNEDKLVGSWSVGDDGGEVDVKKAAAQPDAPKGKS